MPRDLIARYEARHSLAQRFLDRYVRQNIAEIDEIPWREQAVSIQLPAAERALYVELKTPTPSVTRGMPSPHPTPSVTRGRYVELKNHLEALDMKNNHKSIKSKCKSENDREARLAQVGLA